ncbi:transcriptional regulator [Acetobacter nitrogenifigens DSM 23921 = NBRC 105050]|uniref:LysR family transcriptional regulator n=1 Tax=Acetobacter nitrogenifigens DSM 23921 = NBRC 105050 TaxID=1120919 RepID=A0A511XAN7_9PROT|nr:LysR substrate-binding domain-containing protein [Acetobacter nitrogenifigens]GBQ91160.1 transcriptional regulator [Acetobacter nitrogenifigens DSM 23921 = NBRC 105050]GEN59971.1 LysR family transcriptional regulator [Acetobacter nitrogenifigens DSM 23921 = NBRC 105050]
MSYPDLEIDLLRAFVAVAETGSYTAAADVVGRSQSAVSQKVLRLEQLVDRKVFNRTSRSLSLTPAGERLLVVARQMLESNDRAMREFREPTAIGTLRLGISEDFIPGQLPRLLARFSRLYPGVVIDLATALSRDLLDAYDAGKLDAVIAKRDGPAQRGRIIWREPLVWMAAADYELDFSKPARLVMLPRPCSYRELMVSSLDAVRREWMIVATASSLMGVQAAVSGGLGVTLLGRSFVQPGMQILQAPEHWPALPMTEIVVLGEDGAAVNLIQPLVTFLTESLSGSDAFTRAA